MPGEIPDSELIRQIGDGSQESLTLLYSRYRKPLINYLYKYLSDYQAAEDVFQEALLDVYSRIRGGKYREEGKFSSWLFRIAINFANKHIRKLKRTEVSLDAPLDGSDGKSAIDLIPDERTDGAKEAEKRGRRGLLLSILSRLPKRQRQVLLLHEVEGMRYRDIARALSVPIGTVSVWLQRARKALDIGKPE